MFEIVEKCKNVLPFESYSELDIYC